MTCLSSSPLITTLALDVAVNELVMLNVSDVQSSPKGMVSMVTITESTLEIYRKTANHGAVVRPTFQPSHGHIIKTVISKTYHIPLPWSVDYRTSSHLRRVPRVQGGVSRRGGLA